MISHNKKFVYIHIPKTAGSSITKCFAKKGKVLSGKENFDSIYFKHQKALPIQQALGDEFENYYRFTFVRNPFDWIVSNYEFNRGLHHPYVKGTKFNVAISVPKFTAEYSFSYWLHWWVEQFRPSQHMMICDEQGELLVPHIFKFESLTSDIEKVIETLNIKNTPPLKHLLQSKGRKPYQEYFDNESAEFVRKHFKRDLELFDYSDKF